MKPIAHAVEEKTYYQRINDPNDHPDKEVLVPAEPTDVRFFEMRAPDVLDEKRHGVRDGLPKDDEYRDQERSEHDHCTGFSTPSTVRR
jgi:hypothetical protein